MDEQPISEFNAALANAYNAHNLRVGIQRAILVDDYNTWERLLKCLTIEVMSWFKKSRSSREEEIENLMNYRRQISLAKNHKNIKINILTQWTDDVMEYSYDIWFGKEKDVMGSMLE